MEKITNEISISTQKKNCVTENAIKENTNVIQKKSENNSTVELNSHKKANFKKSHTCGSLFAKCKCNETKQRVQLLHSYSHPDTPFIFTPENKLDSSQIRINKSEEQIVCTNNGKLEITKPKRSSSPNIGNYSYLDVAVHPEILLKVSNKNLSTSSLNKTDIKETKKRLQNIRSNSENSPSQQNELAETKRTISFSESLTSSNIDAVENVHSYSHTNLEKPKIIYSEINNYDYDTLSGQDSKVKNNLEYLKYNALSYQDQFDTYPAHQFFKESGILGPMGNGSGCMRKSSKVMAQDFAIKEQIRKTSFVKKIEPANIIPENYDYLQSVVPILKKETKKWENKTKSLEDQTVNLKKIISQKDNEITKLKREIHKLKSVLQLTAKQINIGEGELLTSLQTHHYMAGQQHPNINNLSTMQTTTRTPLQVVNQTIQSIKNKKQGVSGESSDSGSNQNNIKIIKFEKDFRSKQLIKDAIMENDFLKNIDSSQVRELVDAMYSKAISKGEFVIKEGEAGAHLYVSAEGEFQVVKDQQILGTMGPGKAFGELAILYNCTRTASIKVLLDARVWVLDRRVFQQIMMRTGLQKIEENVNFLKSVPLLKNLNNDILTKIADVLEVEFYPAGAYIIRQGASGDTFFLISQGNVKVTQRMPGCFEEEEIRTLARGDYFGEQALIKEDKRTANIIALSPGVECLTLDRDSFIQLIGNLCELHEKDYGDDDRLFAIKSLDKIPPNSDTIISQEFLEIQLNDLEIIATLGCGGFGRVELVKHYKNGIVKAYALKCLKKQHIIDTRQEEHIISERTIMLSCLSPFICRLYRTYRDNKYVYMLLESLMGGEVWTILRDRGNFDDYTAQFIIGCVLQAFEYLHSRGIVYRDLKPENLMLDCKGYVKLVDFGFAKYIGYSSKTWTFCGTPEYVAPEIILNKGHDRAVDYWALGILIHELLTGTPPFTASDPMKTYNIILKGIDMIDFPRYMSRTAISLIKRLCRDVPVERLGYQKGGIQDIKKNKWFQGFDWDGLSNLTLLPPIIHPLRNSLDTAYFDVFPVDTEIPTNEFSGWDVDF